MTARFALHRPGNGAMWAMGVVGLLLVAVGVTMFWSRSSVDDDSVVLVRRGEVNPTLTLNGILQPVESATYRSPLGGRETEITFLAPEGTRVAEGDLLVRLDSVALALELERANQEARQTSVDVQVAEIEVQEAKAAIDSLSEGEAALAVEEARTRLQQAERKAARLRAEQESLEPLMKRGFITRDELSRVADEREQAEQDLLLTRRRSDVLIERTFPRDRQRAQLLLAQKQAQRENVLARVADVSRRVGLLREQIDRCSQYASGAGIVVYEEYLGANPRRKVRVGDRVTEAQGIVTIPNVSRMIVEASVAEADMRRLAVGQPAVVVLEAFRDRPFAAKVTRIGTLARASSDRPFDDKRFDVAVELDNPGVDLRPEMTARVDVQFGQRTGVLLIPINAVFERGGQPVAYVVGRFGVSERPIQVGESNGVDLEVVSGLADGDRVSLRARTGVAGAAAGAAGATTPSGGGSLQSLEKR